MSKKLMLIILAGALMCLPAVSVRAELIHSPTEVVYWNSTASYNGVTLFTPTQQTYASSGKTTTYLIDMEGRLVNYWTKNSNTETVWQARLETNGYLSRSCVLPKPAGADPTNVMMGFYGGCGALEEVDWSGNVKWRYVAYNSQFRSHDDYLRIWNSKLNQYTYLLIVWLPHTQAEAVANGATGSVPISWSLDGIYEIDYSGDIVWKWSFFDHLCQNVNPTGPNYASNLSTLHGKFNINATSTTRSAPTVDWMHANSIGYNADLGYIVINSREFNEMFVINHDGTFVDTSNWQNNYNAAAGSAGDFQYRFGCPANYNAGSAPVWGSTAPTGQQQLWGAHGATYIPDSAYPGGPSLSGVGAGDILVFNNGANAFPAGSYAQAMEINPYVSNYLNGSSSYVMSTSYVWPDTMPSGSYYQPPVEGNSMVAWSMNHQIYWRWAPQGAFGCFSQHLGSAQRLPNGNTLMCAGESGHMIEVTYAWSGTESALNSGPVLAWEYSNPMNLSVPWKYNNNNDPGGGYEVAGCYRYDVGHPALAGRVTMNADHTVSPVQTPYLPGVGATLTGAKPCSLAPCAYQADANGMGIPAPAGGSTGSVVRR